MIQGVKLGTHKICTYMPSRSVEVCVLAWLLFGNAATKRSSKSQCRCGKGCGHKRGSSGVVNDDSYCDKF